MSAHEPWVVQSDQERVAVWDLDEGANHIRCLAGSADTGGQLAFFENRLAPGAVVPPHIHEKDDEYWYMLDAGLEVQLGSEAVAIEANSLVGIPAGTEHAVSNVGDRPVRALFFTMPGGLEEFFEGISRLLASPESEPGDFARLFESTGTRLTGDA